MSTNDFLSRVCLDHFHYARQRVQCPISLPAPENMVCLERWRLVPKNGFQAGQAAIKVTIWGFV